MTKKQNADAGDPEDDPDDALPPSVRRYFTREGPPTAAELARFQATFKGVVETKSALVWHKLRAERIGPETRDELRQEVYTRVWAWVKQHNVPDNLTATINATAWRVRNAHLRDIARDAQLAAAYRAERCEDPSGPDPGAELRILLNEAADQLPAEDWDLLWWFGVDGLSYAEIAEVLGVPTGTVCTRLRAAKARLLAIVSPPSGKARPR
jgi:RNA polymerase sigma factor (sigma-70 family)